MRLVNTFGSDRAIASALIESIEQRGAANTAKVELVVRSILAEVRRRGDGALREYAGRFDGLSADHDFAISAEQMRSAWEGTEPRLREAMELAQRNIRGFAERQLPQEWTCEPAPGVTTGQLVRPLGSVGCYVPGGRYPLPSTLLMTVTPAQVAGVERIVVCSPKPAKETLAAAWLAGVREFYAIGGAQAVAAMAFGTESIGRVDKIVGPGNLYVTAAKLAVSNECGIDMPAGPTEIVVTSERGDPAGIAADLVAQAEHDPEALAVLITSKPELASAVVAEVERQVSANVIAKESIAAQGVVFVTGSVTEAHDLTNRLAPEHLSVDAEVDLAWVRNAGSVFVGPHSPQTMGDYVSGPNHVLPTGRAGRVRGGLSVLDFVKIITVQNYTGAGLRHIGPHAIAMAEAEGLAGHAQSVRVKMEAR